MECNKDEAVRAKQLAESRMQRGQFVEALRFANKAKNLYADVDNITQILAICEVHTAALNKLSCSEMDWYQILQTERLSEEAIIKKQYRKLALILHPDKNKFAGAEAAFKLIGEANSVLSDQAKRSLHDMKVKAHVRAAAPKRKAPSHHSNGNKFAARTAVPKTPSHHSNGNKFAARTAVSKRKTPSHHSNGNKFAASTLKVREKLERIVQKLQSKKVQLKIKKGIMDQFKPQQRAKRRRKW
ncbi:dnaJ homolog subfamily B member 12-like [Trifolium pratense]|uniref:Uncharacterized protein n=1 Tax=Trifolium pratense TaxID=57577 RepID=A0ACB0I8X2_TRIPR|nr:dnaJ homolog subfamily B member 12-like [Trifolium pratense]XP_045789771.1 dnaJ homolog subfamily B member 12-like [Trifolium pratense]CAJ2628623.1 unnamed protein product [Trifolium pratense]